MSLAKFSRREVSSRPTRALLTFLSIMIGVAAVVSVLLATGTTRQAQSEMLKAVSGRADLEIVADSAQGFSQEVLLKAREVDGIEVAAASLNRFATLFAGEKKARTQVLGIDPRIDQQVRDYEITDGAAPTSYDQLLLDRSFAQSLDIGLGEKVKLLGSGGLEEFELVGLVQPSGATAMTLGGAAYLVLPSAQRLFRAGKNIDHILVLAKVDQDIDAVATQLQTDLPEGVTVRKPRTQSDMARETMYATENGLHMSIAFALLISAFIIYNTFQMAVGERRRQIGILRAIGATSQQVSQMILREALWISSAGAIAGCVLGYFGAGLLNGATEKMLQVSLPSVQISALPFLIAITLGMGVAWLGALLPARRASSVEPVEAMRAVELHHNDEVIRRTKPIGFVAIPLGLFFLLLSVSGVLPIGADVVSVVMVLLGCVLLIPVLLESCSGTLIRLMEPWLGVESRLAQKQLMRHVGRSTLTIGVLFVAVSTSIGMAGNILDNVDNVRAWYSRAIIGDFFVRASLPDFATGAAANIPDGIEDQLREIDGIEKLDAMRFVNAQIGEDSVLVITRQYSGDPENFFDLVRTEDNRTIQHLNQGKVIVGSVLAERMQLKPGDFIPLETDLGTQQLQITATTNDYIAGGLTVYMSMPQAQKLLKVEGASVFVVTADKSKLSEVGSAIQTLCQTNGLIFQSYADLVKFIDNMMNGVIASLWMLLALGCIIASMGLVNTLTMNILEQTREIGMLRVVAMTRGQVRRMVFSQALLMGIIGILPGAVAGIFVAYAISQSAMAVLGHNIVYHFRPWLILGCLAFGICVVLLASLIPAERAARLKLSSALHYE